MLTKDLMIFAFVIYVISFTYLLHYLELGFNKSNTALEKEQSNDNNINKTQIKEILKTHPKMAADIIKELKHILRDSKTKKESKKSTTLKEEDNYKEKRNREQKGDAVRLNKVKNEKRNKEAEKINILVPQNDAMQRFNNEMSLESDNKKDIVNPDKAVLKPPEKREGFGEMGEPVILEGLSPEEMKKKDEMTKLHSFNAYLSEKISLHRSLPDVRDPKCKEPGRYASNLPATSVIICFHNEEWTVLLRTVHSVLDRTRPDLLHEVLLIDDFSSMEHLKGPLDHYMSSFEKVKVIHTEERKGLVRARIVGAKAANAPILTYLDSHCEATDGWVEPLIDTVHKNRKTSAVPSIEIINHDTFHFLPIKCTDAQVGGFDWTMGYTWHAIPKADNIVRHPCDNVKSPTMAGGLFSINKYFFEEIGYYDEELKIWGGENVGLSFKIWMCGGRIEAVPCSHVGHIFRPVNPYAAASAKEFGEFVGNNQARIAEAWLDNHKKIYYEQRGKSAKPIDVSKELAIRKKLNCKSFDWYLDNVYPEQFVPYKAWASGEVANVAFPTRCLDAMDEKSDSLPAVYVCHKKGGPQVWYYTAYGEIRTFKMCLDRPSEDKIIMYSCHGGGGNQKWIYNPDDRTIRHPVSNTCLAIHPQSKTLTTMDCVGDHARWTFQHVNREKM